MCGRFVLNYQWPSIYEELGIDEELARSLAAITSYNVAPTDHAGIVREASDVREVTVARWGLVPSWAKDASVGTKMFNARSETAHEKPSFRDAMREKRCVVPISGFYEWQKVPGGKQPWYITRADGAPMLCAGLWSSWEKGDEILESFSVLTTTPNAFMSELHSRMPCVLEREAVDAWLDRDTLVDDARSLLVPAHDGVLTGHTVSKRVGNVHHDDASLITPVEGAGGLFG